ncbi:hypothetical protein NWFMUON74_16650 [Nocardia wallacei]|uniref:Uncharacterized protein n=1 Tax=Nocardia wallacei TaxID=480035 RepID=A0A7G1KI83_9NOCA|nr:hypothetical protein NWFMUON74_16650 [Nocardia wallacei]
MPPWTPKNTEAASELSSGAICRREEPETDAARVDRSERGLRIRAGRVAARIHAPGASVG